MNYSNKTEYNSKLAVLRTLIYYDIFDYPLTESEIFERSYFSDDEKNLCKKGLQELVKEKVINKLGSYYYLDNDPEIVRLRLKGNKKAEKWIRKARWFAKLISHFPYIRGVSVSGSLSKGYMGMDPDIDYFIITTPNRLWFARTALMIFKKIFLLNSYRYFCINYFIDTKNLEIQEKNLFTATEIVTMIPMFGNGVKEKFFKQNEWVQLFYPKYKYDESSIIKSRKSTLLLKKIIEKSFNNRLGDMLDSFFMKKTITHWSNKFENQFTREEFELVFKSSKRISKHHPRNYQKKVLKEFNLRKRKIEQEFEMDLSEIQFDLTENRIGV